MDKRINEYHCRLVTQNTGTLIILPIDNKDCTRVDSYA